MCSLTTASSMTITEAMTTVMMINKKDKNKKVSMYGYYRAYLDLPNPLLSLCQGNGSNRAWSLLRSFYFPPFLTPSILLLIILPLSVYLLNIYSYRESSVCVWLSVFLSLLLYLILFFFGPLYFLPLSWFSFPIPSSLHPLPTRPSLPSSLSLLFPLSLSLPSPPHPFSTPTLISSLNQLHSNVPLRTPI